MEPKIKVNGTEYPLVTEEMLTLGEAAEVERITGQGYDLSQFGAAGMLALTFISVKRVDASVTVDDIRELTGDQIDVIAAGGDAVIPPADSADSPVSGGNSTSTSAASSEAIPEPTLEPSGSPV